MLGSMSQHLRVLVGLLDDLSLKDTETRVANWLLKRCPQPLRTSEALSRTLAKFRDQKLLKVAGRAITITQPRKLDQLLRQHLGEL